MRVVRAKADFAGLAAEVLAAALQTRLDGGARVSFAVSGGRTPDPVFRALSLKPLPWERIDVFQVDERVAPAGDRARNLVGLEEAFVSAVPVTVHPMPVEAPELDAAALRYADELPETLDLVHLGLGADGHTASLIPDDPVLDVVDRKVATTGNYQGHRRMTLTFPTLDGATERIWLVAGSDKRSIVERLLAGDPEIPAGRVSRENATIVVDASALP